MKCFGYNLVSLWRSDLICNARCGLVVDRVSAKIYTVRRREKLRKSQNCWSLWTLNTFYEIQNVTSTHLKTRYLKFTFPRFAKQERTTSRILDFKNGQDSSILARACVPVLVPRS